MKENIKKIKNVTKDERMEDLKLLFYGIIVGLVAGVFSSFYRFIISNIEKFLKIIIEITRVNFFIYIILILASILIALVVSKIKSFSPLCSGSGIPQVEAELKGYLDPNPANILFSKIFGGSLTALCGFSVGREGPSIQIGAMCGKIVSKFFKKNKTIEKFLITCGASAGLSAAFNAPIAGSLFAIEEVHRHISKKLLVVCMSASITADFISKILYGTKTVFNFTLNNLVPLDSYWIIILFGLFLSFFGILYNLLMKVFMEIGDRIKLNKNVKMIIYFIIPIFILIYAPYILGGGSFLMKELQNTNFSLKMLFIIFIVKLLFSIICFSSGIPGGIFFPILVLGATLGVIFGNIFDPMYINLFIILGMAGYLTAIVRAPITAIILIFEMTGSLSYLLPLSIVCLITYSVTNYLKSLPVYEYLLERLLKKQKIKHIENPEKIFVKVMVEMGSEIENKTLKEIDFPKNILITNIDRSFEEIIPNGDTKLLNGDMLNVIVDENNLYETFEILQNLCNCK